MNALQQTPVVIDNGSGVIKAGFAGDDLPKVGFCNVVGRPKHVRVMAGGALEGDFFVGRKVDEHRGALVLNHPMTHGRVIAPSDWADLLRVWAHVYDGSNLNLPPAGQPLLISEAPLSPRAHREAMAEVLFEGLGVPGLHIADTASLALYGSGRTTGLVIDVGDGVSSAVPIYEGYGVPAAAERTDVAGREVTAALLFQLRRGGYSFHSSAETDVVRTMKEEVAAVAPYPGPLGEGSDATSPVTYVLPDGQVVTLGSERALAGEVLFNPSVLGIEAPGVQSIVLSSLAKCDMSLRPALLQNMVLCGGSTAMPGFGGRLLAEVAAGAPPEARLRAHAPAERKVLAWIGGSVLASLSTFKNMVVTRESWAERGAAALGVL